jgi:hypothetical protein
VKEFYDTLFGYKPKAEVFREGERPDREVTLRNWYLEVTSGKISSDFLAASVACWISPYSAEGEQPIYVWNDESGATDFLAEVLRSIRAVASREDV